MQEKKGERKSGYGQAGYLLQILYFYVTMRDLMKPSLTPLKLPRDTPVILVDPLNDFVEEEGVFAQAYGSEDTRPVRDLLPVLKKMAHAWQNKARLILCRSLYDENQFGVSGLEQLCVESNPWGRDCPMHENWFKGEFEKRHNSILVTDDNEIRDILEAARFAVLTGMTLTSCIAKSKEQIRNEIPNLTLVVPRDTTGVRASRSADAEKIFEEWEQEHEDHVIVTPSWKKIKFP